MDSENRKIGRRVGVISFFTLISRILGLLRDTAIAYFFGATATADAFYVAFRLPNLLRRLTGEGALTIAFVPIFTEYLKQSREEGKKVAGLVFTYLSIVLVVIVLLGVVFAPYLVKLIAYGFTKNPEKFELTVYLTRLMFPYILLISLTALAMGILNSLKHFATPAASPILLNVFTIACAFFFFNRLEQPVVGLAIGVVVGGIFQLVLQIPMLVKLGMLPRLNFDYRHPALRRILFLMLPAAFGAAVYQVNVLIITFLASFLPSGSVSYLWYADRVTEFPLGIFAIAIATATLPTLSDHAAENNIASFKETFRLGLSGAFAVTIPAAVGLYVLAIPVIKLLFERGVFSSASTVGTAGALSFFVLGMPFVSGVRNIVPAYFAMKDSKTPVIISTVVVVCNALFALALMKFLLHRGLALAVALSDMLNFFLLIFFLRHKIGGLDGRKILASVTRVVAASLAMGGVVWAFKDYVVGGMFDEGFAMLTLAIMLSILVGVAVYITMLKIIGAPEFNLLTSVILKRKDSLRS